MTVLKSLYDANNVLREQWTDVDVTYFDSEGNLLSTAPGGELPNPRPLTAFEKAEADAEMQALLEETNRANLTGAQKIDNAIAYLEGLIGSGSYVATGITDPNATLTSLMNMGNAALGADFQNNVGRWLKQLLRDDKRLANQTVRLLRLVANRLESDSIGDEN